MISNIKNKWLRRIALIFAVPFLVPLIYVLFKIEEILDSETYHMFARVWSKN